MKTNVAKPRWTKKQILSYCHKADHTGDPDDFDEYEPNPGYELIYDNELVVSFYPHLRMVLLATSGGDDLTETDELVWSKFRVLQEIIP